jgi:hypothetical protein
MHLELSHSLTTDSFIHALRRFTCRRGAVSSLISDNGTNFTGANTELRGAIKQWNLEGVEAWLKQKGISWKFNPPYASHYGGVWEREIRSVRKVLTALMNEQRVKLTDEALLTLMCEVESILNFRPLTQVSDDPQDCDALTPNHLLLLNAEESFPPGVFSQHDSYHKRRWKQVQYLADLFWQRFKREYLVTLQYRSKWQNPDERLKENDLVLVTDVSLPRNQWPLGRVQELIPSEDGRTRTAKIRICKYKDSSVARIGNTLILRPISKLVRLCSSFKSE